MDLGDAGEAPRGEPSEGELEGPLVACGFCNAVWSKPALDGSVCPLCAGPLTLVP